VKRPQATRLASAFFGAGLLAMNSR
jgi:hypothetical protein